MQALRITIVLLLIAIAGSWSLASVPPMINYQGKLMQPSGLPVNDGTYSMTFAIYGQATGGPALWSEASPAVQVKGGLFSVLLGSIVNLPANIFDSPDRWFGVTVGSDPEMTPRQRIASSPFAFGAGIADAVPDGAITTAKIADGAVTTAKVNAEPWSSYTVTWGATLGVTPTVGNGTLRGRYIQSGKTVFFAMQLVGGSATTWGTDGCWTFSLPLPAANVGVSYLIPAHLYQSEPVTHCVGVGRIGPGSSVIYVYPHSAEGGCATSWIPWLWAENDALEICGAYELN